jgi:hypothetical protein
VTMQVRRSPVGLMLAALAGAISACAPTALEPDDVTHLVRLASARALLPASAVMSRGVFDQLHPLTVVDEPDALWSALSVVGVRADPCFIEGAAGASCRPQLRLVLQPVMEGRAGLTTRDAAVHLFFEVRGDELLEAVETLATARQRSGVESAAWRSTLRTTVERLVENGQRSKVTQMSVHASNEAWIFGGFNLDGSTLTAVPIPTLGKLEHHVTSTGGTSRLSATLIPGSMMEPAFSNAAAGKGPAEDARASLDRLESPDAHNPGTVDCGGCHLASTARWHWSTPERRAGIDPSFADTRNLRALGYFFDRPAVSPRTRLETAASLRTAPSLTLTVARASVCVFGTIAQKARCHGSTSPRPA